MNQVQYTNKMMHIINRLRVIDDDFFRLVAVQPGVCQEILRTLIGDENLEVIVEPQIQETVQSIHREIILDAFCRLGNGTLVNIEVQNLPSPDDFRRVRFHASAITAKYTPKGTSFKEVPDVIILYITDYDIFQTGHVITRVKRYAKTGKEFRPIYDGEEILFVTTKVNDGTPEAKLMQLLVKETPFESVEYPELSKAVQYFKNTEGGQGDMSQILEEFGQEIAAMERIKMLQKMILKNYTKEQILELDYTEEEYETAEQELLTQV